jgi:hypothetical protein
MIYETLRKMNLTGRQKAGLAFFYLAAFGWLTQLIVFTNVPYKWVIAGVALVIAETAFLVGIALLGRATYRVLKEQILKRLGKDEAPKQQNRP